MLSRRDFARAAVLAAAGLPAATLPAMDLPAEPGLADLEAAERLLGLEFTDADRKLILNEVKAGLKAARGLRPLALDQDHPATVFQPLVGGDKSGSASVRLSRGKDSGRPLHARSVAELGRMLREGKVTSRALTEHHLERLRRHGPDLLCVVSLLESKALREADLADREIREGRFRGPLHGIPYGAKDLFDTAGDRTTWGAAPYKDRVTTTDAVAIRRMRAAGAILVAKLSMGTLAMGDVWFGGTTKNPWNPKQGSSGSSAGSAAAVAAGLVPMALGTETLGSIISPSIRCRVTGLRPTFGRIPRTGGMFLCPTMDKVGPIVREVEDAALVLAALHGRDAGDPSAVSRPFVYRPRRDLKGLTVGLMGVKEDDPVVRRLVALGATVRAWKTPEVADAVIGILDVECAASHDGLTLSPEIRNLGESSWPATFRAARFVGAVEHLQAQKARRRLMIALEAALEGFDLLLGKGGTQALVATNFTGHPQLALPFGGDAKGNSQGYGLIGRLYEEGTLLAAGRLVQEGFDHHRALPPAYR